MNIIDSIPALSRLAGLATGNSAVQITFTPALPPQVRQQIISQSTNNSSNTKNNAPATPFTLTVSSANGNQITFTSPTGATFTATVSPPLPLGTQLQLSVANLLPQPQATPASSQPVQLPIQARILPPATPNTNSSGISSGSIPVSSAGTIAEVILTPANPQLASPPASGLRITTSTPALTNLITTTILQQTAAAEADTDIPLPITPSLPVPPGPAATTLLQNVSVALLLNQALTLTPTGPLLANGTQTVTLTLAAPSLPGTPQTALPTPASLSIPVTLNLGVALPVGTPQPATLLPAVPTQANPAILPESTEQALQPVLLLTGQQTTPSIPTPPPAGLQVITPQPLATTPPTPATAQTATMLPQAPIPVAGRILPPQPDQSPGQQTALLATGATITLKSPQPLPTGSIIVADLPITPSTGIQRILNADTQTQPQPNTTAQTQTAAAVHPQTGYAVLAAGMVIEGKITDQNEQGQLILTISQPPQLAGQTTPLTLTENTALLPIGAQLSIRVEPSLTATILGLTLPPQTQSAFTVGTMGARWEGLQQALSVLQQQAPIQAANLRATLPQLANLLPGLMAFTNALRTRDPDDFLDAETTKLLKSMGIDLSSDISQLSQLQQRPAQHADTQWRGTLFPYVEAPGEDPRQGGFFWRREKSDNPRSPTNTRFVVEVEMSKLGPMQLDGLVTYPEVWLKLRRTSSSDTDASFTTGLQTLVNGLLESYGLTGGIAVETTPTFPVNPRAELLAQTDNPLPTSA